MVLGPISDVQVLDNPNGDWERYSLECDKVSSQDKEHIHVIMYFLVCDDSK